MPSSLGCGMLWLKTLSLAAILSLTGAASGAPSVDSPREAPPLSITEPSGTETNLSSFRGKVIVVEFLFVRSPHCLQLAELLNRLNAELGAKGFQPVAVAFGPYAEGAVLAHMVNSLKLAYPVGYTTSDKVDAYLRRTGKEMLRIPQIVVVDRRGMVRATSGAKGDPRLENEAQLRGLIESLLAENAGSVHHAPATSK